MRLIGALASRAGVVAPHHRAQDADRRDDGAHEQRHAEGVDERLL
jgi:hypothetical protein